MVNRYAAMIDTLDEVIEDCATRLRDGADRSAAPMHLPALATEDCEIRTMVLREFDGADWTLRFHTDTRAPKAKTIGGSDARTAVGLLFYDRGERIQIRMGGQAWIERDTARVEAAWQESDNYARRCYLGAGPGEGADGPISGIPEHLEGEKPSDEALRPARPHFALLMVRAMMLDWLHLAHDGHRRARFTQGRKGIWTGSWVAP